MSEIHWWDIPVIAVGLALGSWGGNALSHWVKRKLGWLNDDSERNTRNHQSGHDDV